MEKLPDRKTISLWVANFRETGSCLKRKSPGRPRHVRTPENVAAVRDAVTQSPRRSARKQASALGLSQRSLRRILHKDLKLHPYKMMLVQEMKECDWPNRKKCCEVLLENVAPDDVVLSSDEAHFHLSGCVNKQNFRYWAESNPRQKQERPLHSERVTVWCAVSHLGVIGPYFFDENNETVTVNRHRYVHMLRSFLQPQLHQFGQSEVWFQQDGATAHTSKLSMEVLTQMFPSRLICIRGDIPWPARSPDLAACDFFLWGYLKAKVYTHKPKTLDELKDAIRFEIAAIPPAMVEKVMLNFRERLHKCIENEGKHLDDILFRTTKP